VKLRNLSTLQLALGISVAVHAVLLTVRFVDPEAIERAFRDTPLEVILVNARGNVLGLMPHPDRAFEPELGSADGAILFQSALASA